MGWAEPSSIVVDVWMAAPSMVVASTRDWSGVQLLVEEELLFLVGRGEPSCKEPTSSWAHNYVHFNSSCNCLRNVKRPVITQEPTHMRTGWIRNSSHIHIQKLLHRIFWNKPTKKHKNYLFGWALEYLPCAPAFLLHLTLANPRCLLVVSEHLCPLPYLQVAHQPHNQVRTDSCGGNHDHAT